MAVTVRVLRLGSNADLPLPAYASSGASGMDLRAAVTEPLILKPGERVLVPTGFAFEIPPGYEGQVRPRSGLALKQGIVVVNAPGTIDADYRGELQVILANLGKEPFTIGRGDRIAQFVICPVVQATLFEADELSDTHRGTGGFGSTGKG